jgi:uncharacterized phage protein (TIGR01671 family)
MDNKEKKFRIWDKDSELWQYGPYEYIHFGEVLSLNGPDKWYKNSWVFLQYIGIQDKNNKEIYEGDILTGHMGYNPDTKLTGVVEFSTETLGYGLRFNPNPGSNPDAKDFLTEDLCLVHDLEVVGNIYENPDLMEKINLV